MDKSTRKGVARICYLYGQNLSGQNNKLIICYLYGQNLSGQITNWETIVCWPTQHPCEAEVHALPAIALASSGAGGFEQSAGASCEGT